MSYNEAKERIPTQREKIINLLKAAGEEGVTSSDLNQICFRYGARLSELYERGYLIEATNFENGMYRYVLRKTPSKETLFESAEEVLLQQITQQGGQFVAKLLKTLLRENGFKIIRKHNWFKEKIYEGVRQNGK